MPNYHPVHQIVDIKYGSPAHGSTKIEEGDEIVQVNYQTVVGWQAKKVMLLLQEAPPEIVLTLKKRPRHSKVYGQIYMKPYRLPSRKRDVENWSSKWNENLPSPRLLPIIDLPRVTITKSNDNLTTTEAELSSSDSEPPDSPLEGSFRMYPVKPRPILQRRNTITGTTPTNKRPTTSIEQYWDLIQSRTSTNKATSTYNIDSTKFDEDSRFLRDKSASCNVGLDASPRPTTVIGLTHSQRKKSLKESFKTKEKPEKSSAKKKVNFDDNMKTKVESLDVKTNQETNLNEEKSISVNSLSSTTNEEISFIDEGRDLTDRSSMIPSEKENAKPLIKDPILAEINVHSMIKKFDQEKPVASPKPRVLPRSHNKKPPEVPQKPAVPPRSATTKLRGRLDKSHSTPAYDLTEDESSPLELTKLEKLPDVVPKIPETITESSPVATDTSEFSFLEDNSNNSSSNVVKEEPKSASTEEEIKAENQPDFKAESSDKELPPKPPPRKSLDLSKPAYPADSPKPVINTPDALKPVPQKKTFDFTNFEDLNKKMGGSTQSIRSVDSNDYLVPIQVRESHSKKGFEPKLSSTPVARSKADYKEADSFNTKVSPTNSIVRAMISNKGKLNRKKNSLIAKRRRVTVNDLSPSDIQGFLYQRIRNRHTQNVHWEKRWFVLLGSYLYGYKNKDDPRAACLIFLSDFTVAVASEVKSRLNAFKVYHTGTVFYFSAEDADTLQVWLDLIRTACLHNNDSLSKSLDGSLCSETDDDSDTDKSKTVAAEKTGESLKKFGSLKKFSLKKAPSEAATHSGSTSLDRKWFFNKSSANTKTSVPVPTAQFRSYRKIKNEPTHASVRTGNFTSHVPMFGPSNLKTQTQNISVPNLTVEQMVPVAKLKPKNTTNYIHASNPSLCNVSGEYGTTSSLSSKNGGGKERPDNLEGFVTLAELMNRQNEENRKNPHHEFEQMQINLSMIKPDVIYGEVPVRAGEDSPGLTRSASQSDKHESSSSCFGKRLGSLKKNQKNETLDAAKMATYPKAIRGLESKSNRSLPRTLKMQETTKECEEYTLTNFHYSSDRNLANFRKKSYEMIYCPETINESQFAQNRLLDETTPKKSGKVKRQPSFEEKKSSKSLPGFTNRVGDVSRGKLKSAIQYTPISLPMSPDSKSTPKFAFELNLDEKQSQGKTGGKFTKIFSGKSSEKKEKTFLGSPKLHRAIFRKQHSDDGWASSSTQAISISSPSPVASTSQPPAQIPTLLAPRPHADYPGLEYPPIFEPETYSLADPQSSLNLLRSKQKKDNLDQNEKV